MATYNVWYHKDHNFGFIFIVFPVPLLDHIRTGLTQPVHPSWSVISYKLLSECEIVNAYNPQAQQPARSNACVAPFRDSPYILLQILLSVTTSIRKAQWKFHGRRFIFEYAYMHINMHIYGYVCIHVYVDYA